LRRVKKYRLSICKGADCKDNGSDQVFVQANASVKAAGLGARCEVFRGGCYGLCHLGPNVVIREETGKPIDPFASDDFQLTLEPGETYYWKMTPEKMSQVVREHLGADRPVEGLRGDATLEDDFRKRG
jgi:(2Fe-2S) ferredoxin